MRRVVASLVLVLSSLPAAAQDTRPPLPAPDFLLSQPRGWVSVGGAFVAPRAGGELFRFVSDQLTIDRSDFRTGAFAAEVGAAVAPNFSVVGGVEAGTRQIRSEYRHFISSTSQPIEQTTKLDQQSLFVGLHYTPLGNGRRISRFAFIPRRVVPSVAAGLNLAHYEFAQNGQFVDYVDLSIFPEVFQSSGWALGPFVRAGADIQVWRRVFLSVGGKYAWAHAGLERDFIGFDGIDLAGFSGNTGFSFIF